MTTTSYSQSIEDLEQIAAGYTSSIYRVPLEHKILKVLDAEHEKPERLEQLYKRELAAYQRMEARQDRSINLLKFYGAHPTIKRGLILELAERGDTYRYLHRVHDSEGDESPPEPSVLLQWAKQLAEALKFVHSCNILHCDIHVLNCFLDEDLNLKLGDFGACSIDTEKPLLMYRSTHQLWTYEEAHQKWTRSYSIQSEIFALGCTLYYMETGRDAFHGYDSNDNADRDVLVQKLQRKQMPLLDELHVLGYFIDKCWTLRYSSMEDVLCDIQADSHGVRL